MPERFEAKPGDLKLVVLTKSFFHSSLEKGRGGRARGETVGMSIIIGSSGPPGLQNVEKAFLSERIEAKPGDLKLFVIGVIKGTRPNTKPSLAKAEDRFSAIKCSG